MRECNGAECDLNRLFPLMKLSKNIVKCFKILEKKKEDLHSRTVLKSSETRLMTFQRKRTSQFTLSLNKGHKTCQTILGDSRETGRVACLAGWVGTP